MDPSALGYSVAFILKPLRRHSETRIGAWLQIVFAHSDAVFGDEILALQGGLAGQRPSAEFLGMMWKTSSKLPMAVALRIERDWRHAHPEAAAIEKAYRDDPIVMNALLQKYVSLEQVEDAKRCAQRLIEIAPDYGAYKALANIYLRDGQREQWEQTLRESLKLPSGGLEQSQVHNQLRAVSHGAGRVAESRRGRRRGRAKRRRLGHADGGALPRNARRMEAGRGLHAGDFREL